MISKDIAVVGLSCNFSRSGDIREFWKNLRKGDELLDFPSEVELHKLGMDESSIHDPDFIKVRSVLERKDSFDAAFFGYTRQEAALMDPQIRLFHEYTYKALEDAGCDPYEYKGNIGLFAGATENLNWMAYDLTVSDGGDVDPFFRRQITNRNFIASLVSYKLNLRGPVYFVDTACSTSLAAIHMACRSLLMRECSMAVAGAVSLSTSGSFGYRYEEGMIFSRDGHCKTFDADASGTISGEGVGVVVLKRLDEAIRDKDHIYAVIRSTALNNDGNRKVGYTAPSASGQAECISLAHRFAGIPPASVSYVEAHGTATRLGDPIEVEALNRAFGNNPAKHCAIGSVKSVLGHLDTAAGVAGFIKTVLALYHKEIPPSLHFKTPNPEINFDQGPFYVNRSLIKWERTSAEPLRAGVSAFGIGGTNIHVVLEEAPLPEITGNVLSPVSDGRVSDPFVLLPCSAKSNQALRRNMEALEDFLKVENPVLSDVAYTLQQRRRHFGNRGFLVGHREEGGQLRLQSCSPIPTGSLRKPAIVFMFSGSGMQYVNMGKGLYDSEPVFQSIIDEGLTLLEKMTGRDFRTILFRDTMVSGDDPINDTRNTQPLIFIFEFALANLLNSWGIQPDHLIGHSTGELAAACFSGVFTFEDGLYLVVKRSELMSRLSGGAMIGVGMPVAAISSLLNEETSVSAINSPEHCVVSGTTRGIERLEQQLDREDVSVTRLRISIAAHSFMMEPVIGEFNKLAAGVKFASPRIPMVSNISGKVAGEEILSAGYWAAHIRDTVDFSGGISSLVAMKKNLLFLEIGPGNTLSTFCSHTLKNVPGSKGLVWNLIRHPLEQTHDRLLILDRIGKIWQAGVDIDWKKIFPLTQGRVISLPGYHFDKNIFPTLVDPFSRLSKLGFANAGIPVVVTDGLGSDGAVMDGSVPGMGGSAPVTGGFVPGEDGYDPGAGVTDYLLERPELSSEYVAPVTQTEVNLVQLCQDLFGISPIGIEDNFFELGGDSLKVMTLAKRVFREMNVKLPIEKYFIHPTIRLMAREIDIVIGLKDIHVIGTGEKRTKKIII